MTVFFVSPCRTQHSANPLAQGWANIFYGGPHWIFCCYRGPHARITYVTSI